jgi:hypothetical protein
MLDIRRRDFITFLGGAAAWPLAAGAQQGERMRRIGVLVGDRDENDPTGIVSVSAFTRAFEQLGWTDGRNVRIDIRWAAADVELNAKFAKELVGFPPRRHPLGFNAGDGSCQSGDEDDPNRVRHGRRSDWRRVRGKLSPSRRESHWLYVRGILDDRKVAPITHRGCAEHQARRNDLQSRHRSGWRFVLFALF